MTTEQATKDCAAMGATTDEHKMLEPFAGTFHAEVKMWMGPGEPMVSTGTMTNDWDLGGRFLRQTYVGDPGDGPFPNFEGRGFWGYNTIDKRFEGVWLDTACTFMQTEQGQVDDSGKVWTMLGSMTSPQTGEPMAKKSVVTLIDDDHHLMEMYFEMGGQEMKGMEIRYKRK